MKNSIKLKVSILVILISMIISSTCALAYECPVTHGPHYIITEKFGTQTCTTSAVHVRKCGPCGYVYSITYLDALGHNWVSATCTQPRRCIRSGCGATSGEELGHSMNWNTKGYWECVRSGCGYRIYP